MVERELSQIFAEALSAYDANECRSLAHALEEMEHAPSPPLGSTGSDASGDEANDGFDGWGAGSVAGWMDVPSGSSCEGWDDPSAAAVMLGGAGEAGVKHADPGLSGAAGGSPSTTRLSSPSHDGEAASGLMVEEQAEELALEQVMRFVFEWDDSTHP